MKFDIIIIGAGASGLAAAYHAINQKPQLNILVIEKENTVGRKLNASGNGKCNLTNRDFHFTCYHSDDNAFVEHWIQEHTYEDIITFFEKMGILLYEKNGYYYPISNQAKQVSMLLYEKSKQMGVNFVLQSRVTSVSSFEENGNTCYKVSVTQGTDKEIQYEANYVLLATGGRAAEKLGGCEDGYNLAKQLGMKCNRIFPVLSPIYVDDSDLTIAKGVRLDGTVTMKMEDGTIIKEAGQIQFNANNLSGIVMMNLSCHVNKMHNKMNSVSLHIDALTQYSWDRLKQFFLLQTKRFPNETIDMMLQGILPIAFVAYIMKRLKIDKQTKLSLLTEKQWNRLTSMLKKLEFTPVYVEDFGKAQVTGGGVSVREINPDTFESCKHKNLYITGELLDVNGKCGGYNLTFAILSGIQAVEDIIHCIS